MHGFSAWPVLQSILQNKTSSSLFCTVAKRHCWSFTELMLGTQVLCAHLCSDVLDLSCAFLLVLSLCFSIWKGTLLRPISSKSQRTLGHNNRYHYFLKCVVTFKWEAACTYSSCTTHDRIGYQISKDKSKTKKPAEVELVRNSWKSVCKKLQSSLWGQLSWVIWPEAGSA